MLYSTIQYGCVYGNEQGMTSWTWIASSGFGFQFGRKLDRLAGVYILCVLYKINVALVNNLCFIVCNTNQT